MWGPREVQHLVRMCLKRVQWFPQPFDVVEQDSLFGPIHQSSSWRCGLGREPCLRYP